MILTIQRGVDAEIYWVGCRRAGVLQRASDENRTYLNDETGRDI